MTDCQAAEGGDLLRREPRLRDQLHGAGPRLEEEQLTGLGDLAVRVPASGTVTLEGAP